MVFYFLFELGSRSVMSLETFFNCRIFKRRNNSAKYDFNARKYNFLLLNVDVVTVHKAQSGIGIREVVGIDVRVGGDLFNV